jgi:hypothetical protein
LMQSANGFVDYLYVHTNMADSWPTLREMRDSGKVRGPRDSVGMRSHGGSHSSPCTSLAHGLVSLQWTRLY